jgi:hypothetical protein
MIVYMRVVAGGAVHLAVPEALAGRQQRHLVAVDIRTAGTDMRRHCEMRKRIPGSESEQRSQLDIVTAAMTYCA